MFQKIGFELLDSLHVPANHRSCGLCCDTKTISRNGGAPQAVTTYPPGGTRAYGNSYSPDGNWILVRIEQGDLYALYKIQPDGNGLTQITPELPTCVSPELPERGMRGVVEAADDQVLRFPSFKEQVMRPYAFIFRLSVLLALVLAAAFMAGWKWGGGK